MLVDSSNYDFWSVASLTTKDLAVVAMSPKQGSRTPSFLRLDILISYFQ